MVDSPIRDGLGSIAAQAARAQLVLAMLLAALFPTFLLYRPIQTHAVRLDLPLEVEEQAAPADPRFQLLSLAPLIVPPEDPARYHRLVVTAYGVLIDGAEVDLLELRRRLDVIAVDSEWVDLRPDSNARYEMFLEVLAITRRAQVHQLRLDNSRFWRALDEDETSRS